MGKRKQKFSSLAEAISVSREKMGITQREVSRRTGIDNNTIAKIEKGERKKPNTLSLKKLGFALNIDINYLLELAGYTKEEIEITNSVLGANMCMRGPNGEVVLVEETLIQTKYQKMAYSVIVELIDNCDFKNIEFLKGKSEKEISKIKEELQMIRDRYVSNEENYKEN